MGFLYNLKLEIGSIEKNRKRLKHFGLTVGGIFIVLGALFLIFNNYNLAWLGVIGLILLVFGFFQPNLLFYPYIVWMGLAILVGFIISEIILIILFYLLILPIGLLSRLFRGNFLNKKFDQGISTYWVKYKQENKTRKELEQLY